MLDGFDPIAQAKPYNLDAEMGVLGALLFENDLADRFDDWLRPEHFHDPVNGRIYGCALSTIAGGSRADHVVIRSKMENDPGFIELGGAQYLAALVDMATAGEAAVHYGRVIRDLADKREMAHLFQTLTDQFDATPSPELVDMAEHGLAEITDTVESEAIISAGASLRKALEEAQHADQRPRCGLSDIDVALGGFRPGKLYIIAGRSSMGKSALGGNIARRLASKGFASLFCSLEMPDGEVSARWASDLSGVPYFRILQNQLEPIDREAMVDALGRVDVMPLDIADVPGASIGRLRAQIRRWKREQIKQARSIGVVVIDFLQLIREPGSSIYERATEAAKGLQTLARTLDVPIIAMSQLARDSEREKDKRPAIRHLRDSGAIEEAADAILLMYRDSYYAEREPECDDAAAEIDRKTRALSKVVEVDIAKNRQGPLAKIELIGELACNRFEDMR